MPTLSIDGKSVQAAAGETLLNVARRAGVYIPTLCHHEAVEPWGGCRLCLVDITRKDWDGWAKMVVSCMYPAEEGLIVQTTSERVMATRKVVLDLLLARCPETPLVQKLAAQYGVTGTSYDPNPKPTDCILCGLCTRICDHLGISAISGVDRGAGREVAPPFGEPPPACIGCLACAEICPTAHIKYETSDAERVIWNKTFEMLRCARCGRATITKAQAEFHDGKNGVPASYFSLCDSCKRKETATTYARLRPPVQLDA